VRRDPSRGAGDGDRGGDALERLGAAALLGRALERPHPPLVFTREEIDEAIEIFDDALESHRGA